MQKAKIKRQKCLTLPPADFPASPSKPAESFLFVQSRSLHVCLDMEICLYDGHCDAHLKGSVDQQGGCHSGGRNDGSCGSMGRDGCHHGALFQSSHRGSVLLSVPGWSLADPGWFPSVVQGSPSGEGWWLWPHQICHVGYYYYWCDYLAFR